MEWFYWLFENWYTRYPFAIFMGFLIQNFYMPANSKSPYEGIALMFFVFIGTAIAYGMRWK